MSSNSLKQTWDTQFNRSGRKHRQHVNYWPNVISFILIRRVESSIEASEWYSHRSLSALYIGNCKKNRVFGCGRNISVSSWEILLAKPEEGCRTLHLQTLPLSETEAPLHPAFCDHGTIATVIHCLCASWTKLCRLWVYPGRDRSFYQVRLGLSHKEY